MDDDELEELLDPAWELRRSNWLRSMGTVAAMSESLAPSLVEHDEELASMLEAVAHRLREVADRVERKLRG